jgi:hypothetical protein
MTTMAINVSDERLNELWNSREALNKKEWGELYQITYQFLNVHSNKARLGLFGLENEIDDYINGFFEFKVMRNFNKEDRLTNRGHLIGFFRLYLIDQQRKEKKYFVNESFEGDDDEEVKTQREDKKRFDFSIDEVDETLSQFSLSREELNQKTQQFFESLEEWQQAVLMENFCPDAIDKKTLSKLPERYPQTASYYKVTQLGIIHKTSKLPSNYKTTMIGKWIHFTLGIRIEEENMNMILVIFRVLCVTALNARNL